MSVVRVDGGLTEWFVTVTGVMQGCLLCPLLYNILLEVVMALALDNWESRVKVSGTRLTNLRSADDISLLANSEGELQQLVHFSSGRFGLVVSGSKTEVQCTGREAQMMNIRPVPAF